MIELTNPKNGTRIQIADSDLELKFDWKNATVACTAIGDGWRLPSQQELELIYIEIHKKGKGNFKQDYYWSSNAAGYDDTAWYYCFKDKGFSYSVSKSKFFYVRPVREL